MKFIFYYFQTTMTQRFQPAKLDVDPTILDSNLMLIKNEDDPLSSLFPSQKPKNPLSSLLPEEEYQSVTVVPKPGLCIKSKNAAGSKFFINLCKLSEIPAPPPIDESELSRMIEAEDYTNLWKVPMSLGAPRRESDKSGGECWAAEVAVNSAWFDQKMVSSELFTSFVITIAMEGLYDKYGEDARLDRDKWTVLKNKKFLGDKCPAHTIQLRQNIGIQHIEESSSRQESVKEVKKSLIIEEIGAEPSKLNSHTEPEFEIRREPHTDPVQLKCRVSLPGVTSVSDLSLDVGEDRIVVSCVKTNHLLDIFLPYNMDVNKTTATFALDKHDLHLTLPLLV